MSSFVCHSPSHSALFMAWQGWHTGQTLSTFLGFISFSWLGFALFSMRRPPFFSLDLSFLFHFPFTHEKHKRKRLLLLENTRPQGVNGFLGFCYKLVHLFLKDRYFSVSLFLGKKKKAYISNPTLPHTRTKPPFSSIFSFPTISV